jgi:hypothetical protein
MACRNDISGGRTPNERRTAKNSASSKYFTSLCYSADGRLIMGGGRSKWVVMYEVSQRMRIKRYQLSRNRAIGGTVDFLDSRMLTEAGPMELIDDDDADSDKEAEGRKGRIDKSLPGTCCLLSGYCQLNETDSQAMHACMHAHTHRRQGRRARIEAVDVDRNPMQSPSLCADWSRMGRGDNGGSADLLPRRSPHVRPLRSGH